MAAKTSEYFLAKAAAAQSAAAMAVDARVRDQWLEIANNWVLLARNSDATVPERVRRRVGVGSGRL